MSQTKPRINTVMRRLERIRRRIPYAFWLFYDVVFLSLLVFGLTVSPWFWAGFPFLGLAVFFDVVEFIVKATEDRWAKRFFEGTGDPTPREKT
jgi:hypothetical protein